MQIHPRNTGECIICVIAIGNLVIVIHVDAVTPCLPALIIQATSQQQTRPILQYLKFPIFRNHMGWLGDIRISTDVK